MSFDIQELDSNSVVKQANKLIESIYRMDMNEHKVILLAIKTVQDLERNQKPFTAETEIVITAAEFANEYGMTRQSAFELLQEAKNTIYERSFDYFYKSEDGTIKPMNSRWIHAKGEMKAKSEISMFFAPAVIPYIYLVKKEFTLLDLAEIGRIKNKYAIRLYQHLMQWRNADKQKELSVSEFRGLMGLDDGEYTAMCDLKKRVINPAVTQINKATGFSGLKVITKKKGAKVVGFSFPYTKYDNTTINVTPLSEKKPKQSKKTPKNGNQDGEYRIDKMTPAQIKTYVAKIIAAAKSGKDGFADLGKLVDAGKDWDDLVPVLTKDFENGVFEPYYAFLKLVDFTPTKINKEPPESKQGENGAIPEGDPTQPPAAPKQKPVKAAQKPAENEQLDIFGRVFRGTKARTIASNMLKQAFAEDNPIFSDIKERMELGNHTQLVNEIMADLEAGNLEKYEAELRYFESRRML